MATRVYCDHCGLTVTTSQKYAFGPHVAFYTNPHGQVALGGQSLLSGNGGNPYGQIYNTPTQIYNPPTPTPTQNQNTTQIPFIHTIDLCKRCESTWIERVKMLCKASDPQ